MRACILDRHLGNEVDGYYPAILDALRVTVTDITGSVAAPTDPAIVVIMLDGTAADLTAIEVHPDYGPGAILYDLPNPYKGDEFPPPEEHGKRRSYCAQLGIKQADFEALFGKSNNRKARKQAADNLIAWTQGLKGKNK